MLRTVRQPSSRERVALPQRMENAFGGAVSQFLCPLFGNSSLVLIHNFYFQSRCRAVVYDSVQHICHYFLDGGLDVAVPAAKMIYLRVTSKQCLDERSEIASNLEELTLETVIPPIPVEREPLPRPSVQREEDSQETRFTGSFDVDIAQDNEIQRDIKEPEQRWQSSMEKLVKNDEDMAFKRTKMGDVSAEALGKKKELQSKLQRKLEMLQEKFPDKYVEYVKGSGEVTTARPTTTTEKMFNMVRAAVK